MNSHDFTYLLQNPQDITPQKTEVLQNLISKYPYFQSVKALHLKGLKNQESTLYNNALKVTATYTTDRSILFDFITSKVFIQNEISEVIKHNTTNVNDIEVASEDISVNKSVLIDDTLKQQIKDTSGVLDPDLFQPKEAVLKTPANFTLTETEAIEDVEEHISSKDKEDDVDITIQDILHIGKPLEFDKQETYSFNEWLSLAQFKPIKRAQEPDNSNTNQALSETQNNETDQSLLNKSKKNELIDKFISQSPKIIPSKKAFSKKNLAKDQMLKPEALMTETLARIYVEQKNYKKAIKSYKILSLKYPEKSGFFANQIKAIEQLQEQNKEE